MSTVVDFSDDELMPVEILWSSKYACPIYKVGNKMYIEDTGEYAGYFDDVTESNSGGSNND